MTLILDVGDLVRLRGREWVVEALKPGATHDDLSTVELACIADDAQGETLSAVLDSEIDVRLVQDDLWDSPSCPVDFKVHWRFPFRYSTGSRDSPIQN
jgi:hypothetical protein